MSYDTGVGLYIVTPLLRTIAILVKKSAPAAIIHQSTLLKVIDHNNHLSIGEYPGLKYRKHAAFLDLFQTLGSPTNQA